MDTEERDRIRSAFQRLEHIENAERQAKRQEEDLRQAREEDKAKLREQEYRARLERLGLADLFHTGAHLSRFEEGLGHVEVFVTVAGGKGRHSEAVFGDLLARLEQLAGPASAQVVAAVTLDRKRIIGVIERGDWFQFVDGKTAGDVLLRGSVERLKVGIREGETA